MRRVRIFFTKRGEAAYISHLDLQRVMARALRRSGLPVWYSQGFNPHIYMSFALPLPLMQESVAESVDCRLDSEQEVDLDEYVAPLNNALPSGIAVLGMATPVHNAERIAEALYEIRWPGLGSEVKRALDGYHALEKAAVLRKTKRREVTEDLKLHLPRLSPLGEDGFEACFPAGSEFNLNPALLTGFFQERFGLPASRAQILRRQVYTGEGEEFR